MFWFLRSFGMRGHWYGAAAAALFASTIPMALVAYWIEGRGPATIFSLTKGSWAFILGDALALPLVAGASALVWKHIDAASWWRSGWWTVIAIIIGLGASAGFHWIIDAGAYSAAQNSSPTKIVHDMVAYTVLFSGLTLLAVPAILQGWTLGPVFGSVLAIFGIAAWGLFGLHDAMAKLNPNDLHVAWDWSTMSVEPMSQPLP